MSSPGAISPWPGYPDIPIFLDTRSEYQSPRSQRTTATTFDTSGSISPLSPNDIPRCIKIAPPSRSVRYSVQTSNSSSAQQSGRQRSGQYRPFRPSRYLSPTNLPEHNPCLASRSAPSFQTSQDRSSSARAQVPEQTIRFTPVNNACHTTSINPQSTATTKSGLGISDATSILTSAPFCNVSSIKEKDDLAGNIVQRIENTLWRYSITGNIFKRWLLEIISWVISTVCMGAIVGVLWYLKDKTSSTWPLGDLGVSLNTYVAILSRISAAALLLPTSEALGQLKWSWFFQGDSKKMWDFEIFDNASRGPWGSFQLLVRTKGRKLAALGAAIVIFALALDPFFQQILDFTDSDTLIEKSSVPKVTRYAPTYSKTLVNGVKAASLDRLVSRTADVWFFENGTEPIPFGNGTRADIPVSCPASSCTWPPYETLGVCSECTDIANLLTFNCTTIKMDWLSDANLTNSNNNTIRNGTVCGYFLNSTTEAPVFVSGYAVPDHDFKEEVLLMRTIPLTTNPRRNLLYEDGSIHFKEYRNTIVDFLIFSAANGTNSVHQHEIPVAKECILTWCVQKIQSSYDKALYKEEVLDVIINKTAGPSPWRTSRVSTPAGNGTLTSYDQNIVIEGHIGDEHISGYGLSNETAFKSILVFDDMFPSLYTLPKGSEEPLLRFKLYQTSSTSLRSLDPNPWVAPNNITTHLEGFAAALTNAIRSSTNKEPVFGLAYVKETYVKVQFAWLGLPVSLLFFSAIFLIATMVRTSREKDHVGVWKTSAVATLLYGLPDEMQKKITLSSTKGTPRATAKELKVKLQPGKGWRISGNLFSPLTPIHRRNQPPPGWI